jgi:hypothetical protein
MPPLPNGRQERFCQGIATEGKNISQAYADAGYKPCRHSAWQLSRKPHISSRIAEIQADREAAQAEGRKEAIQAKKLTLETLLGQVEDARKLAMEIENPAAAVAASKELGVLSGLRIERQASLVKNVGDRDMESLSDVELTQGIVNCLFENAKRLNLDVERTTLAEYADAMMAEVEANAVVDQPPPQVQRMRVPPPRPVRPIPRLPAPRQFDGNGAGNAANDSSPYGRRR